MIIAVICVSALVLVLAVSFGMILYRMKRRQRVALGDTANLTVNDASATQFNNPAYGNVEEESNA